MATLPLQNKISQSSKHMIQEKVQTVSYGNGYEQSAVIGMNQQADGWTLSYLVLDEIDRQILLAFWREHGNHLSFEWNGFGDTTTKSWKIAGQYKEDALSGELYKVSFAIKQVFELGA